MEDHVRFFAHTTGFDDEVFFTHGRFTVEQVIAAGDIAAFPQARDVGVVRLSAAMAAGLAIAASGVGGIAELAPDGEAALLSGAGPRETSAALMRLAEDDELASRLGQAARERAGVLFEPRAAAARLQAIYAAAMENKAI
jgi:glycosyltransferase involved in cell wall biosynthesis